MPTFVRKDGYLLQGLLGLPVGIWLISVSAYKLLCPELYSNWGNLLDFLLLSIVIVGYSAVRRYYRAKGGLPQSVFATDAGPLIVFFGFLGIGWGFGLTVGREVAIAAQGVWLGLALLLFGRRFLIHRVAGSLLLAVSLIVPFALPVSVDFPVLYSVIWSSLGFALIVGGVYEHVVFVGRDGEKTAA